MDNMMDAAAYRLHYQQKKKIEARAEEIRKKKAAVAPNWETHLAERSVPSPLDNIEISGNMRLTMEGVSPISKADVQTIATSSATTIDKDDERYIELLCDENNRISDNMNRISLGQPSPPDPSVIASIRAAKAFRAANPSIFEDSSESSEEAEIVAAPHDQDDQDEDRTDEDESSEDEEDKKPPAKTKKTKQATKKRQSTVNPSKKAQPQQKKKKSPVLVASSEDKIAKAKETAKLPFFLQGIDHTDTQKFVCFDEPWSLPDGEIRNAPACVGFIRDKSDDGLYGEYDNLPFDVGGDRCDLQDEVVVDLRPLLLTQWRQLVKKLSIASLGNKSKAQIRFGIGQAQLQAKKFEQGEGTRIKTEMLRTCTFVRLVNAISAPGHVEDFLRSNDRKVRVDHETGTTNKKYYQKLADRFNEVDDNDEVLIIQFEEDETIQEASFDLNLKVFNHKTTTEVQKMVKQLVKGRRKMKENMTVSGTHSSDPWDFAAVAAKFVGGVGEFEIVYFYRFCEEHNNEIDHSFGVGGTSAMLGDSTKSVQSARSAKKSAPGASELFTKAIDAHSVLLCEQMKERNLLVSKSLVQEATQNEQAQFFKCLESCKDKNLPSPLRNMAERQATMIGTKYGWM
jgi:hypothetical protein